MSDNIAANIADLRDAAYALYRAQNALDGAQALAVAAQDEDEADMVCAANGLAYRICYRARRQAARVTGGFIRCDDNREPRDIARDILELIRALEDINPEA